MRIQGVQKTLLEVSRSKKEAPKIWVHCASLGEFEQARPLLEHFRAMKNPPQIALSFFSPSGYVPQAQTPLADEVYYLPWDFVRQQQKFVESIQPQLCILIKYEFWPNLIHVLQSKNIPIVSVSSRFNPQQFLFKPWGKWLLKYLAQVNSFFVQDQPSKDVLKQMGIEQVQVVGDTRMDRVSQLLDRPIASEKVQALKGIPYGVLGSSWPEDEALFWPLLDRLPQQKWVVAPHDISEKRLQQIENLSGKSWTRWSTSSSEELLNSSYILVDTIGELKHLYAHAQWAYVGGGMGTKGLHNILEAGIYGIPVIIGKNYQRFQEAIDLIEAGGVFSVSNPKGLESLLVQLIKNPEFRMEIGGINQTFINQNKGASNLVFKQLQKYIS